LKAKKLAFCAMISALSIIFLYLAFVIPTGKAALYTISSVFLAAVVLEAGLCGGIISYFCVSILALFLIPDKTFILPYVLFFGYYPVVKQICESKIKNRFIEYFIKFTWGNVAFWAVWFLAQSLFSIVLEKWPLLLFYLAANVFFFLYDYVFTLLIHWYQTRIRSRIRF
jgi:riboflavin transporter FmnP